MKGWSKPCGRVATSGEASAAAGAASRPASAYSEVATELVCPCHLDTTYFTQLHEVSRMLHPKFPQVAELLEDAAEDVLAHLHFPREHRRRLHSTNPLERLHKEIKRRTRVVGIFPTRDSLMRMVGTLLAEQDDEWQVSDRRYFSVGSMAKVDALEGGEDTKGAARSDRVMSEDGGAEFQPLDGTRPAGVVDQPELRQGSGDTEVSSIARNTTPGSAPGGSRTPNLLIRSQMLYPLSYGRSR